MIQRANMIKQIIYQRKTSLQSNLKGQITVTMEDGMSSSAGVAAVNSHKMPLITRAEALFGMICDVACDHALLEHQ